MFQCKEEHHLKVCRLNYLVIFTIISVIANFTSNLSLEFLVP